MVKNMEHLPCRERVQCLGLLAKKEKQLRGCKITYGESRMDREENKKLGSSNKPDWWKIQDV